MKLCSTCKHAHEETGAYCKPCRAAYMRTWRAKQTKLLKLARGLVREVNRHDATPARRGT